MGYAQNDDNTLQANVHSNGDNPMLIHIRFNNPTQKMAKVSIRNPKNNLLYSKWTTIRQANLKLDIEHMPSGIYTITIHNKNTKIVKHVEIKSLYTREEKRIAMLDW